ncbi:hypothetical protein BTHERMOSOX_354 [Bathymodiolus thermophilus thioautotrophic gill symbiont]|nr:hypothetical protein BTHERMOSOX_354 [Bathymodiolus thermophilus thioautotrophic gill symbiont]
MLLASLKFGGLGELGHKVMCATRVIAISANNIEFFIF